MSLPEIKLWKPRNAACIYLAGKRIVLGPYGSRQASEAYLRIMADIAAAVPAERIRRGPMVTVGNLADAYRVHALSYYRKGDRLTTTAANIQRILELLTHAGFTATPLKQAGPLWLREFQQTLAADEHRRWSRQTINEYVRHVVGMFQWAVAEEIIPPEAHAALKALPPLKKGRAPSPGIKPPREDRRVAPPEPSLIRTIRRFMPRTIRVMVDVQILTGTRPNELCRMRWGDLHRTRNPSVFVYVVRPEASKTDHIEHLAPRRIYLGPRAIRLITLLKPAKVRPEDFVFSPARAAEERRQKLRELRKTPMWPSHSPEARRARAAWRPVRWYAESYEPTSYRKAVQRACLAAGVPKITPYQLRHLGATRAAERADLEVAQSLLGHTSITTTMGYIKVREKRATRAAARMG